MAVELRVIEHDALLLHLDVEDAQPLPIPRKMEVRGMRRDLDPLLGVVRPLDGDDVVAAAIPDDRGIAWIVLEHGGLAAKERDEHVTRHRDRREPRDVAGAGRAVEKALLA